jgi:hypothetical protein
MKNYFYKTALLLAVALVNMHRAIAAGPPPPPPPPPGGGPPCFPPPCIPINGGIQYLVVIGFIMAIYTAIKIRKQQVAQ